jgi:gamma-glutamyltranspeptidase
MVFRAGNGYPSELNDNLGKLLLVVGASGGPKIPTAVIQAVTNFVLLGMPLYDAITRPRLHDQLIYEAHSATLYDESPLLQGPTIEISDATMQALASRGHVMVPVSNTGCVQAVAIDQETGKLTAVSDIRKGGKAAGF